MIRRTALARCRVCLIAFAFSSGGAAASVVDTYGLNARSIALGNAAILASDDAFAAHANPAALTNAERTLFSVDYQFTDLQLNDLSPSVDGDASGLASDSYRASQASNLTGNGLGINLPLLDGLHFGLAGYMPSGNFGRIWGSTASDRNYLRYSDRQQRPAIFTALAAKLPYGFSVGAGSYYTLKASGYLQLAFSQQSSAARFTLDMEPILLPYGGIQWQYAFEESVLRFGLSYRSEQSEVSSINSDVAVNLDSASLPLSLQTSLAPFFDPELYRFAVSWEASQHKLYASSELARWSSYQSPDVSVGGSDIAEFSAVSAQRDATDLRDTYAYRLGYEYSSPLSAVIEGQWRLGFERHTSALGSDRELSSIVDLNRNVLAIGFAVKLLPEFFADERSAKFEITYQRTSLEEQSFQSASTTDSRVEAGGSMQTLVGGFQYAL